MRLQLMAIHYPKSSFFASCCYQPNWRNAEVLLWYGWCDHYYKSL